MTYGNSDLVIQPTNVSPVSQNSKLTSKYKLLSLHSFLNLALRKYDKIYRNGRNLMTSLILLSWKPLAIQCTCALFATFLTFGSPFFMNRILAWLEVRSADDVTWGWILLLSLFACSILVSIMNGQQFFHGRRVVSEYFQLNIHMCNDLVLL
jgi:hypothetical protein